MIVTSVKIDNVPRVIKARLGKILRKATADIRAMQLEQIASAFKNGGQPSAKWKPLWADTFKGNIAQKHLQELGEAHTGLFKSINAFKKASNKKALSAIRRIGKSEKRLAQSSALAVAAESYRKGGKPLRDIGFLMTSFFTKYAFVFEAEGAAIIVVASNAIYAGWQHSGFKTKGPNFIPLTRKARRHHVLHHNPTAEGLEQGVDYIMAWKGVDVPARPIIDYADPVNRKQIGDVIRRSIAMKG
jgi:hypothetical protein